MKQTHHIHERVSHERVMSKSAALRQSESCHTHEWVHIQPPLHKYAKSHTTCDWFHSKCYIPRYKFKLNQNLHLNLYQKRVTSFVTDSIQNATPLKSTKSRNSHSPVQIQFKPKSQIQFVPKSHIRFHLECYTPEIHQIERLAFLGVQIQIQPKSQIEFVPRDTEASAFRALVHLGVVAFWVESDKYIISLFPHIPHTKAKYAF